MIDPITYKFNQLKPDKLTFQNQVIKKKIKKGIINLECNNFFDYDYEKDKNQICQISSSNNFNITKTQENMEVEETSQSEEEWGYFRINFQTLKNFNKCKNYGIIVNEIKNIKNILRIRSGYNLKWQMDEVLKENQIYLIKKNLETKVISFDFYYTNPGPGKTILSFPELICYRSLL